MQRGTFELQKTMISAKLARYSLGRRLICNETHSNDVTNWSQWDLPGLTGQREPWHITLAERHKGEGSNVPAVPEQPTCLSFQLQMRTRCTARNRSQTERGRCRQHTRPRPGQQKDSALGFLTLQSGSRETEGKSGAGFTLQPQSLRLAACIKPCFELAKPTFAAQASFSQRKGRPGCCSALTGSWRRNSGWHCLFSPCRTKSWFIKRSWGQYNFYIVNKPPARPALQPNPACRSIPILCLPWWAPGESLGR